ncbi:MAG: two-component system response regulator [Bacteroidetes bacterium]|nr:two-component system response regulator [Bacteroidota bacterium]
MDKPLNILYIDDEANNLIGFKANFRRLYTIYTAESAKDAKAILKENNIQIIITDQRMPDMTGIEFLESILTEYPDVIRIILTGFTDLETVIKAINKGQVYKYISKPFNTEELKITLDNAFEVYYLREENKELTRKLLVANEQLEFMLRQKLLS